MSSGEFIVTASGDILLLLKHYPRKIEVFFKDQGNYNPCNPHHDKLSWHLIKKHHHYYLKINWHVENVRIVYWNVRY
jgi:hypothetical protein